MKKTFYSNGKLMITAEYVVLDGAKCFALPTKFGQNLIVKNAKTKSISWTSYDADGSIWFEDTLTFERIIHNKKDDDTKTIYNTLIEILHNAYVLNPDFITNSKGYKVTTELTFPKFWGLGTSSTLINNIAQWTNVDAFELLNKSFGGSGYDIACAQNVWPVIYQLIDGIPKVSTVSFNPPFASELYFVYLNQKQNSKDAIAAYRSKKANIKDTIEVIDNLTKTIIHTKELAEFAAALKHHEEEMSEILETQTVQQRLFSDFTGVVKSLGAWGGDFVLVVAPRDPTEYFHKKGYKIIIPFKDMIL